MNGQICRRHARGQELVEFALTLLALILLFMGIFDLGRAVICYTSLQNAAREGARYAIVHEGEVDQVKARVVDMAHALGSDFDTSDVQVICPDLEGCTSGHRIRVRATYAFTPVTPLIGSFFTGGQIQMVASSTMWAEY